MDRLSGFFTTSIRRRILTGFAVVILLVVVAAIGSFYQLTQVARSATEMVPASVRMGHLQDLALAISSLDADLERFFVISGIQFQEAILVDLEAMHTAVQAMQEGADGTVRPLLQELEQAQAALDQEVLTLVESEPGDMSPGETNERILLVYSWIDEVKALHEELMAETQVLMSSNIAEQERVVARVITQFLFLSLAVAAIGVLSSTFVTRSIATPLGSLADTASRIADGELDLTPKVERKDEIGALAQTFASMTVQLRALIGGLEQRVTERTAELERRSHYLEATASVARDAASILDVDELLARTARLISERFGFYHTGIFLLDAKGEWAVLQAASSEGGQHMLERRHRLRRGVGIVGRVVQEGVPRVALDVGADAAFFDNPELPDTRTEVALPLQVRGEIIGVLDVQSREQAAASEEDVVVLHTLADQVATAISNARLFAQRQQALDMVQRAYGELSWKAWTEILRARTELGFVSDRHGVARVEAGLHAEAETALRRGQTISGAGREDDGRHVLAVPIRVRGQVIGVIDTYKPAEAGEWTAEEITLLERIAEELDPALESARLYQDTQRRAAREQAIRHVTDRMRRSVEIEAILESTIVELAQTLGAPRVYVRLGTGEDDGPGQLRPEGTRVEPEGGNGSNDA